jgi:phospholipid/cholesterol/gamma-HCH transport system substrate-binding protein
MYKHTTNKMKLGVFVTLGMVIFILAVYFVGERQQMFRKTFHLSGVFRDVGGLQAGNNVRFSGINVGTVADINVVSDSSVRVDILIDEGIRKFMKKDATASIGSEGLMGNKTLIMTPGTGGKQQIENNDTVRTVLPMSLDDIMASVKTTIDNASNITGNVSKIASNIQEGKGTVGRLLMDKQMSQEFDSTFASLREGSAQFKMLMDKANTMGEILLTLKAAVDTTNKIAMDLSKITNGIQSGKGTIGHLLMDETLPQNVDSTVVNLKEDLAAFNIFMQKAKKSWLMWGF